MIVLDTNILVTTAADNHPHASVARAALDNAMRADEVAISRQVLREFLSVMSRPQAWLETPDLGRAIAFASRFTVIFTILEDGPIVWSQLLTLARSHRFGGKQVHDANIVATMLAHGATRLLTFNAADFRRFAPLIEIVEP